MDSQGLMSSSGSQSGYSSARGLQFKIAVFGGRCVGKTTLSVQYVESHFVESHYPTNVQNEFTKLIRYKNNDYTLEIVDTAGQEGSSMVDMKLLMACKGIILCYSVVNRQSFELISLIWDKIINQMEVPNIPVILVGNKIDLRDRSNVKWNPGEIVTKQEGKELAKKLSGALQGDQFGFIETSTKLNINIDEAVMLLLKKMENRATNGFTGEDTDNKCSVM